jgi:hypothetical protein
LRKPLPNPLATRALGGRRFADRLQCRNVARERAKKQSSVRVVLEVLT